MRGTWLRFLGASVFFATLGLPATAHAQTREADAERLFREGQKLMEERRYGEACPKFEAAYQKDGQLGTLINLAFCHKEQGASWYAWLEFREAEVKATELGRADRRDFARARLAELEKGLPKVIVDNPQDVPLTDVLVDDRKVWEAERGAAFAAEGGPRKLTFRAKGKQPASTIVVVARGDRPQHIAVPEMSDALPDEPAPPQPLPPELPKAEAVAPPPPALLGKPQRTIGWIAIGAGGGAALLGTVTGAVALFGPCAHQRCGDERDAASTTAAISTVSYIVAGVGLVGGLVLVLTAPAGLSTARSGSDGARAARVVSAPSVRASLAGVAGTF